MSRVVAELNIPEEFERFNQEYNRKIADFQSSRLIQNYVENATSDLVHSDFLNSFTGLYPEKHSIKILDVPDSFYDGNVLDESGISRFYLEMLPLSSLSAQDIQSAITSPSWYQADFIDYLNRTASLTMDFVGVLHDGSTKAFRTPYKHRWENSYREGVLAKFYQLEHWAKRHKMHAGMISLTTAQRGFTDLQILERLKVSWAKLADSAQKMGFLFFDLYEPHASGVPHMHAVLMGGLTEVESIHVSKIHGALAREMKRSEIYFKKIKRLESLWHDKYQNGLAGIDFVYSEGIRDNENIKHIASYLMKYLSKTVVTDILDNPALIRFHSLFYETGGRLFSSSRYLSFVMKRIFHKASSFQLDLIEISGNSIYDRSVTPHIPSIRRVTNGLRYKRELDSLIDQLALSEFYSEMKPCLFVYGSTSPASFKYELLPFEVRHKFERAILSFEGRGESFA